MTEAEWLACDDPRPMLAFLKGRTSDRKVRLFAVACCRRVWNLLTDDSFRRAAEVAERFADGSAGPEELQYAYHAASEAFYAPWIPGSGAPRVTDFAGFCRNSMAKIAAMHRMPVHDFLLGSMASGAESIIRRDDPEESRRRCDTLRDVFNPFRPARASDPLWRIPAVLSLAQAIYADRAFDRLPVLADALKDAGCTDNDILAHCRGPGPHVRGCWVIDLLLGKE
jgi:hypothetical protein